MKKILTIIFDGFGVREEENGNAIKHANMQNFETLLKEYPNTKLNASEEYVGLKNGQFGNSEVGHMTIGAGRLIKQNEVKVTDFLSKEYELNDKFNDLLKEKDKNFHLVGLCSDGAVHSNIEHFLKLYELLVKNEITSIHFHLITDGRDTNVNAGIDHIKMIEDKIKEYKVGDIATICGRYYAMDRDDNYDRTKIYYDLITKGIGIGALDPKKAIQSSYDKEITDEFIKPIIINLNNVIKDNDIVIWMNYRKDRATQILNALSNQDYDNFKTKPMPNLKVFSFLPTLNSHKVINFIEDEIVTNPLGIYLSNLGITQARIAESEKYPHVTYFFDGGYEGKIDKCTKIEIPSPNVETYDKVPEMSAIEVTKKVISAMKSDIDFILVNYANPDMVGHTGDMDATVKACMALDICLGKLLEEADDNFYKVILLADHGNADYMHDENGNICTTHTTAKVPFIIKDTSITLKDGGDLTMVAPTILHYMDIAVPSEMKETEVLIKN